MINIDTRLMDLVQKEIINTDEFFILLCIAKRVGKNNTSFPSRETLMKETKFGKTKVSSCITGLCKAGILEKRQREIKAKSGQKQFSSNEYKITTSYLSIFVSVQDEVLEEKPEITATVFEDTQLEDTQNQPLSINQSIEVLTNSFEVKKINKKENLKPKQKSQTPKFDLILDEDYQKLDPVEVRKLTFDFWTTKKGAKTELAFKILFKTLTKMSVENQIKALEQAIIGNYSTVYEIVEKPQSNGYKAYLKPQTQAQKEITNQVSEYANF